MLTKLEDQILLAVKRFEGEAYGINVFEHVENITEKKVSVGVVYFALDRLTKRGYLTSFKGSPTAVRGGMRKKFYQITDSGVDALNQSKALNERMWEEFSTNTQEA